MPIKRSDPRIPREEWQPTQPKEKPPKGAGMFPIGGQSREEWEPQQNPGTQPAMPNPRTTDEPDILATPDLPHTSAMKKGGPVIKKAKKPAWRRW